MASRDPLLPNAAIVARREYRDRVRSPLYVASTVILMGLAILVALAPIGIRYLDRGTVTAIAVVSSDDGLGQRAVAVADSILNGPPPGIDPATFDKPYRLAVAATPDANSALLRGEVAAIMTVERLPSGQVDVTLRTSEGPEQSRAASCSRSRRSGSACSTGARACRPGRTLRPSSRRPSTSIR